MCYCCHCNRRGHKAADCREHNEAVAIAAKKTEEDKKLAKRAKNKKHNDKRNENKKQKAGETKNAAAEARNPGVKAESSTSEEDSPRKGMQARMDRVELTC